jgi:hypothetical protein
MSTTTFTYKQDAVDFIQNRIATAYPIWKGSYDLKDQVYQLIDDAALIEEIPRPSRRPDNALEALLPALGYAVRNDDIKLIDALVTGLTAATSANFFADQTKALSAIIGILGALMKLGRDVLKGVQLSDNELLLLTILKRYQPVAQEQMLTYIMEVKPDIDDAGLTLLLGDLSQKQNLLGTRVPVVAKTSDARWVTIV